MADERLSRLLSKARRLPLSPGVYIMKNASGSVIYGKNEHTTASMASTTKILTTLIALEHSQAEDNEVTFTKEMIAEGSSMYLKEGYRLHLSDLATGMMTVSGNDAANAAAIAVAGSIDKFAKLMNNKAKQIGMTSTNFVTPSGLDDDNHYSTALDMAKLMSYAMANKDFAQLTALKNAKVEFISPENMVVSYSNHNRLLSLYKYCNGGKTGFTKKSGRCLVTSAEKDGVKLIAVTLNAPDDWNDHASLLEAGFSRFSQKQVVVKGQSVGTLEVAGGQSRKVEVLAAEDFFYAVAPEETPQLMLPGPGFVYAPAVEGADAGVAYVLIEGKAVGKVPVVFGETIEQLPEEELCLRSASLLRPLFWPLRQRRDQLPGEQSQPFLLRKEPPQW